MANPNKWELTRNRQTQNDKMTIKKKKDLWVTTRITLNVLLFLYWKYWKASTEFSFSLESYFVRYTKQFKIESESVSILYSTHKFWLATYFK